MSEEALTSAEPFASALLVAVPFRAAQMASWGGKRVLAEVTLAIRHLHDAGPLTGENQGRILASLATILAAGAVQRGGIVYSGLLFCAEHSAWGVPCEGEECPRCGASEAAEVRER